MEINKYVPRCVVCNDEGTVDNGMGERMPCEMCQFVHGLPRPVVVRFADDMEQRLRENDHKGGWSTEGKQYMANILSKACTDLLLTLATNGPVQLITSRAADVANIAMMISDNEQMGAWPKVGQVIQDMETGKYLKHDGTENNDFPFVYVDRPDQAEKYENLAHALYVAYWHTLIGHKYRVIDYDAGGVQYVNTGPEQWAIEQPDVEAKAVPAERRRRFLGGD